VSADSAKLHADSFMCELSKPIRPECLLWGHKRVGICGSLSPGDCVRPSSGAFEGRAILHPRRIDRKEVLCICVLSSQRNTVTFIYAGITDFGFSSHP
jgi:hypothetical protein